MSVTIVTIANTDTLHHLGCASMYADTMRKLPCLDDESVGGQCVAEPCSPCANDTGFTYFIQPGDFIPLQFRLPDTVNPNPFEPELGWREGSGDWWLEIQLIDPNGGTLYQGDISNIASSAYVAASDEYGPFQVAILSADKIMAVIGGAQCFIIRTRIRIRNVAAYRSVTRAGAWDMITTFPDDNPFSGTVGQTALSFGYLGNGFGIYRRTATGWEQEAGLSDGMLVYVETAMQMYQYAAGAINIVTMHGAAGGGSFSRSQAVLGSAFSVTDTVPVDDGVGSAVDGGVVLGVRFNPWNSDQDVASIRTVRRWNGVQSSDNAEAGRLTKTEPAAMVRTTLDDDGPLLVNDSKQTRVAWCKDDPNGVVVWAQGYAGNGVQPSFYRSADGGETWTALSPGGLIGQEFGSLVAYGLLAEWCAASKNGRLYFSNDGGLTWSFQDPGGLGTAPIVGRINADTVLVVGSNGAHRFNTNRGDSDVPWSPLYTMPDIGRDWAPTEVLNQGPTVWVFGVGTDGNGVLFRSQDNGGTWSYLASGEVLGGRAAHAGFNKLVATSYIINEAGAPPVRAGQVYYSTNAGTTWTLLTDQPSGGAEALDAKELVGTFTPVEFSPGDVEDQFDRCDSFIFRIDRCERPTVKFEAAYGKTDCLGYYHGTEADFVLPAFAHEPQGFYHEFRLLGSAELDELQVDRENSEDGRFIRSSSIDRTRVRLAGLPESVVRRIQAVIAAPNAAINGASFDTVESLKKNNDEGAWWWLDFKVSQQGCDTEGTCE
jgi:hypothetical protein